MPLRREADLSAGLFLDGFQLRPADFLDRAALDAYQMVVMRAVQLDLEAGHAVLAYDVVDQVGLFEHLQGPEDRGPAQAVPAQCASNGAGAVWGYE